MAKPDDIVNFLVTIPLFHDLNNKQLKQLAKRFVPRSYEAGKKIVTQGKGGEGMFVILSGQAVCWFDRDDRGGTRSIVEHGNFTKEFARAKFIHLILGAIA